MKNSENDWNHEKKKPDVVLFCMLYPRVFFSNFSHFFESLFIDKKFTRLWSLVSLARDNVFFYVESNDVFFTIIDITKI